MSADERPAKRAREEDTPAPEVTRSPDYWLEDGSIVLQVETTQFRVAKTTLAKHSVVFRDMLSFPLPADEPLLEGCPIVVLSGDSAVDWKHLLDAMHPNQCFLVEDHPSMAQLSAVLRLSTKYQIPLFRQPALDRLREHYPSTLEGRDKIREQFPKGSRLGPAQKVIPLARECGVFSVLPTAFYHAAIDCAKQEIGDDRNLLSGLSERDQLICYRGHLRMIKANKQRLLQWLGSRNTGCAPCAACTQTESCKTIAADKLEQHVASNGWLSAVTNSWQAPSSSGFCAACAAAGKTFFEESRKELWDKLPSYFDLPAWDELLRMDAE
ncbi:BTB domain-containing protein [Mycena kentingensis (nom. inval.)]|nr:BTB domain-containing protein [Mycena kentingensis (nom. inval.)]